MVRGEARAESELGTRRRYRWRRRRRSG